MRIETRPEMRGERSRARKGWTKRKTSRRKSSTFGIGKGPWRLHAPVAGTTTASGSRASSGSFPLARTIWRVRRAASARSGVERPPMKDARKPSLHDDGLAPPAENFLGEFLLHQKPEGLGRHWTRARRGRWSTWTGSRTLPRTDEPADKRVCTRTSEVRVAETAAVIGQRPACVLFTNGESASRRGRRVTRVLAGTLRRVTGLPTRYLNALDFLSPRGRANR